MRWATLLSFAAVLSGSSAALAQQALTMARADLALSANDGKAELVNGVNTVPANPTGSR
jgi:hypothetical protein